MSTASKRRVKVYQLDDQGQWEDKGTGYVDCTFLKKYEGMGLIVKSEKEPEFILLESKIFNDDIYQLQADTLIVWNDPEIDLDLALSFQESSGCKEVWDQICSVQKIDSESNHRRPKTENFAELPVPTVTSLEKIEKMISSATTSMKKEQIVNSLLRENGAYLKQLFELFTIVEDLEDKDSLHLFFNIFKGAILLNETNLLEILFTDEFIYGVLGPLEYDPEISKPCGHREYVKKQVSFKEIVPFKNPETVAKIHLSFRLQYLKDVILPRSLDDPTFGTINSLIFINNVEIVNSIQNDETFLKQVFAKLTKKDLSSEERRNCIAFVQELCNLAKHLQTPARLNFYQTLHRHGIANVLQNTLKDDLLSIRLISIHILDSILAHEPFLIRNFILSQKPTNSEEDGSNNSIGPSLPSSNSTSSDSNGSEGYPFFNAIIHSLLTDPELGVRIQLTEIIRAILDVSSADDSKQNNDKEEFLNLFYSTFIPKIAEPLSRGAEIPTSVAESICDILAFCVQNHGYRIKYFILGNNIVSKVAKLLKSKQTHVVLSAIRFFRAFIGMKDDFYHRHLTKYNLFEPIMEVFIKNGRRYNLLNSSIIELFDFIRKENIKHLISHLHDKYKEALTQVDYVDTCKLLLLKYDQNHDESQLSNSTDSNPPTQPSAGLSNTRELVTSQEDEDYFKEDVVEEKENNTTTKEPIEEVQFQPRKSTDLKDDGDLPVKSPPKANNSPGQDRKGKLSFNIKATTPLIIDPCTTSPASVEAVNPEAEVTASNLHSGLKTMEEAENSIENSESSPKRQRTE